MRVWLIITKDDDLLLVSAENEQQARSLVSDEVIESISNLESISQTQVIVRAMAGDYAYHPTSDTNQLHGHSAL